MYYKVVVSLISMATELHGHMILISIDMVIGLRMILSTVGTREIGISGGAHTFAYSVR